MPEEGKPAKIIKSNLADRRNDIEKMRRGFPSRQEVKTQTNAAIVQVSKEAK